MTSYASLKERLFSLGEGVCAYQIANLLSWSSPRILMYHRFGECSSVRKLGVRDFEQQMKYLRENSFNVISLKDLCSRITNGQKIKQKTVVITVDDGYDDFYLWAYPVLKKYQLPATIFVTSDFLDKKIWLWPDMIEHILAGTKVEDFSILNGDTELKFSIRTESERKSAWSKISAYCMKIQNQSRLDLIQQLSETLLIKPPTTPTGDYSAVSWDKLRTMNKDGIDVGGHTSTHPILTSLPVTEAEVEIIGSKSRIEAMLEISLESFAYPNGEKDDYNEEIKRLVMAAGYKNAAVAFLDLHVINDIYELRRYAIGVDMRRFKNVVHGAAYVAMHMQRSFQRSANMY